MSLNAALLLHQYRAWIFLLKSILAISQEEEVQDNNNWEELKIDLLKTLGSLYQEMRTDRGVIMLS